MAGFEIGTFGYRPSLATRLAVYLAGAVNYKGLMVAKDARFTVAWPWAIVGDRIQLPSL
jgi:hypothetical protein